MTARFQSLMFTAPVILFFMILCLLPSVVAECAEQISSTDSAHLFDYDPAVPLDVQEISVLSVDGAEIHDISYASPKGGRVTSYLVVPKSRGPYAGIVFGHWGCGTRTEFLPEAVLYAKSGAVSLLIDYPWVRPAPWRRNTLNIAKPEADLDVFAQAVVDLRRGIDLLLSRDDIDQNRLAYVGHSYGAQWGAIISAVDKRIKGAVLMGGVGRIADVMRDSDDPDFVDFRAQHPGEELEKYIEVIGTIDSIHYVPHSAPVPLFFQFARNERYFSLDSMKRYAQAASDPKLVKWYDTGHDLNDTRALADRARWLEKLIKLRSPVSVLRKSLQ